MRFTSKNDKTEDTLVKEFNLEPKIKRNRSKTILEAFHRLRYSYVSWLYIRKGVQHTTLALPT